MVRPGLVAHMRTNRIQASLTLCQGGSGRVLPVFYMARTYRNMCGRPSLASLDFRHEPTTGGDFTPMTLNMTTLKHTTRSTP